MNEHTSYSPIALAEARGWITDCWDDVDPDEMDDDTVVDAVRRHYDGGWAQFLRDIACLLLDA